MPLGVWEKILRVDLGGTFLTARPHPGSHLSASRASRPARFCASLSRSMPGR
jgi:hypothetical protein